MPKDTRRSRLLDTEEFERWLAQAEQNLHSASGDSRRRDYNWAAFKAQQAGELALKALLKGFGRPGFGHSLTMLLKEIVGTGVEITPGQKECASTLVRHRNLGCGGKSFCW